MLLLPLRTVIYQFVIEFIEDTYYFADQNIAGLFDSNANVDAHPDSQKSIHEKSENKIRLTESVDFQVILLANLKKLLRSRVQPHESVPWRLQRLSKYHPSILKRRYSTLGV